MADVLNRTTKEYLKSVNTPDYPTKDWIHNPDLSAVTGVSNEYWKISGDTVTEMNQTEKDTVDAAKPKPSETVQGFHSADGALWNMKVTNLGTISVTKV